MKIVLAYSGGLDTSVIVKWLKETYDAEIVTFAADVGQEEELKGLDKKALKTGASKHYTLDLVEEFASDFIYPMIRANAIYEGQYYLGTSIARPLIAKAQVDIAKKEKADTVAHGATGKGKHTTTVSKLIPAEGDTRFIDTPGIKEFGLLNVGPKELVQYFPELYELQLKHEKYEHLPRFESYLRIKAALESEGR
jgi:argininosuccinate synthase